MRRSLHYRGFGLTVDVPERFVRAFRPPDAAGPAPANGRLVVEPPPPVRLDDRAAQRDFARSFAEDPSRYWHGTADPDGEIATHAWYHTIEFPDGSVTPGMYDHRPLVPSYGLPPDLQGKRALDIGSADGFWAFELERRGAEVTSLDIETFADTDFPRALHDIYTEHPVKLSFRRGMEIAHRRLGSKVKLLNLPVYDLDPDVVGTFDFVHAGDILLHLRDPALALRRIREVTAGECLLADLFDPDLDALGTGPGLTRYEGGWTDATWWRPALSTLAQMIVDAGFDDVQIVTTYQLTPRGATEGPWRAVFRGRVAP